jgi:hypothetical protein
MSESNDESKVGKPTEREKLEQEKAKLAKDIGIWGEFNPVDDYQETAQFKRINEIDKRLSEIING